MRLGAKHSPGSLSHYQSIHRHLKNRADLYHYFKQGRGALMPGLKACDLDFLLQLLAGDKLLLVKTETLPSDESLSNCSLSRKKLAKLCCVHPVVSNYLPKDPSRLPAEHLCRLLYALDPDMYAREVKGVQASNKRPVSYRNNRRRSIRRDFADILLKMQSTGDGRDEDFLDLGKSKVLCPRESA